MKLITIFTPTYNRAYILEKCFISLKNQSSLDFLWQIIDDGSTDDTRQLVDSFKKEANFEIQYIYKKNGGKVSAINMSMDVTKTPLWMCLDSDDYLTKDAVKTILDNYKLIEDEHEICGIFGLRSNKNLKPMQGKSIPSFIVTATQYEIRHKYKLPPEYFQVYKTNIISKYKYPLFPGEKFMPLSYVQDQIDLKYKFFIMREPVMICEYLDDGITKNHKKLIKNNPKGYTEFRRQQMILARDLKTKIVACITYGTGNIISHNKNWLHNSPCKLLSLLCYPLSIIDYLVRYKMFK